MLKRIHKNTMESLRKLILRHQWFLIFLSIFLFSLVLEEFNNFFFIFVLLYSLLIPGYVILRHYKFNSHLDAIEKVGMSFFFSLIFLTIIGSISWIFIFNKWILALFLIIIPAFIEFIFNIEKNRISLKPIKKLSNNLQINTIVLILIASLISVFIHAIPSILNDYPLGFDTYRLHIIRINYILNDGRVILGDMITEDFLNPFRYQWGYHLFVGSLGLLINQNSIFLLKMLPVLTALLLPLSIYTACPLFGLNKKSSRIFASLISPLFFHDPFVLGLIYPFPSSVGLILFIFSYRILYEVYMGNKKLILFYLLLVPFFFYFYKGLGIILFLILMIFLPVYLQKIKSKEFGKTKLMKFYIKTVLYCVILSIIAAIFWNFVFQITEDNFNIITIFWFEFNISQLFKIEGIIALILFFFSLFYLLFEFISKNNKLDFTIFLQLIFFLIISSGFFLGSRWLFYLTPIITFSNGRLLCKIIRVINLKIGNFARLKRKKIILKVVFPIFIVSILSFEPLFYNINPSHPLNPEFGDIEEDMFEQVSKLNSYSIILARYTMFYYLNAHAIDKNMLYIPKEKYLYFYYIDRKDYPLKDKYQFFENGSSIQVLNFFNEKVNIIDINDIHSDGYVSFSRLFSQKSSGEINFSINKDTYELITIDINSAFGREISILIHLNDNQIILNTSTGLKPISTLSINNWYDFSIKFNNSETPNYKLYLNSNLSYAGNFSNGANNLDMVRFYTSVPLENYHLYIDPPIFSWELSDPFIDSWHRQYGTKTLIYHIYVYSPYDDYFDNIIKTAKLDSRMNITYLTEDYAIFKF